MLHWHRGNHIWQWSNPEGNCLSKISFKSPRDQRVEYIHFRGMTWPHPMDFHSSTQTDTTRSPMARINQGNGPDMASSLQFSNGSATLQFCLQVALVGHNSGHQMALVVHSYLSGSVEMREQSWCIWWKLSRNFGKTESVRQHHHEACVICYIELTLNRVHFNFTSTLLSNTVRKLIML